MTDTEIEKLALDNGFKLKEQPDGSMALNPYVFEFARAMYKHGWSDRKQLDFQRMYQSPVKIRTSMGVELTGTMRLQCSTVVDEISDVSEEDMSRLQARFINKDKK